MIAVCVFYCFTMVTGGCSTKESAVDKTNGKEQDHDDHGDKLSQDKPSKSGTVMVM